MCLYFSSYNNNQVIPSTFAIEGVNLLYNKLNFLFIDMQIACFAFICNASGNFIDAQTLFENKYFVMAWVGKILSLVRDILSSGVKGRRRSISSLIPISEGTSVTWHLTGKKCCKLNS